MYIYEDLKEAGVVGFIAQSEALNFGYSVFETIKVVDGKPEYLKLHFDRLFNSCKDLDIPIPERNELEENMFKFISSREGDFGLKVLVSKAMDMPLVSFSTRKLVYASSDYENGFSGVISSAVRDENSLLTYHKTSNYMLNFVEKKKALQMGYSEPIFLNTAGMITEGATTNIFFLKEDKIFTPKITDGILPGVVRRHLIEESKLEICEYSISKNSLSDFSGAVLTNSLIGVIKLNSINEIIFDKSDELYRIMASEL